MTRTPAPRPYPFGTNLDEWVRHVVDVHFHPTEGTPFWIERAKETGIDARKEIRCYEDLARFGFFSIESLRTRNVLDFMPIAQTKNRGGIRVHESGGTTGAPSRVPLRHLFRQINDCLCWYLDEIVHFPRGGNWLFVGPTGPHGIAESTMNLAETRDGICYLIDLDPRFIKVLMQQGDMRTVGLYMEHIKRQTFAILESQPIDFFGTTPVLLQALAPELKQRGYQFKGVMYGGTQLGKDLYHLLRTEFFPNSAHTAIYGNTLMGGAMLGTPEACGDEIVYFPMEPFVKLDVVEPEHPDRLVAPGQTGRVCMSVLSEERLLIRVLERDIAERWPLWPALGSEGVANVRSQAAPMGSRAEGVY